MNSLELSNNVQIPQVGFGLWQVKDEKEFDSAVKTALDAGYTHFDTAQVYGNEDMLGRALKKYGVNREDIFITTKLWNEKQMLQYIEPSFQESLDNLQTDYVNLFLVHFPVTHTRHAAWRIGMQEIYKSTRARAIGVSNYTIKHLEELKDWGVKPMVNQVELHVYLQQPELLEYCKQNDIIVEAYSPLAHGQGLDNPVLLDIAKKHDKSSTQIMIRWCVEKNLVVLPKSVTPSRIYENIDVFDFGLDAEDMSAIEKLDSGLRTCWDPTNVS